MTENDYIAEYVKEKHRNILGTDFWIWKMIKHLKSIGDYFSHIIKITAGEMESLVNNEEIPIVNNDESGQNVDEGESEE